MVWCLLGAHTHTHTYAHRNTIRNTEQLFQLQLQIVRQKTFQTWHTTKSQESKDGIRDVRQIWRPFRAEFRHAAMRAGTLVSPADSPGSRVQTGALTSFCLSTWPRSAAPASASRDSTTVTPSPCRAARAVTDVGECKIQLGTSSGGPDNCTGALAVVMHAAAHRVPSTRTTLLRFWSTRHYRSGARAHARISGPAGS